MLFGASYFDRQSIIDNTVAFAKASRLFEVPVVLSTVGSRTTSPGISGRRFSGVSDADAHRAVVHERVGHSPIASASFKRAVIFRESS